VAVGPAPVAVGFAPVAVGFAPMAVEFERRPGRFDSVLVGLDQAAVAMNRVSARSDCILDAVNRWPSSRIVLLSRPTRFLAHLTGSWAISHVSRQGQTGFRCNSIDRLCVSIVRLSQIIQCRTNAIVLLSDPIMFRTSSILLLPASIGSLSNWTVLLASSIHCQAPSIQWRLTSALLPSACSRRPGRRIAESRLR
jgi:hypothetical protein